MLKKIILALLLINISLNVHAYSFKCNYHSPGEREGFAFDILIETMGESYPLVIKQATFNEDGSEVLETGESIYSTNVKVDLIGPRSNGWSNYHSEDFNLIIQRMGNRKHNFIGFLNWSSYSGIIVNCTNI